MSPPNEPKTGVERELDLLWKQGVDVVRADVKEIKQNVKDLAESVASSRRWAIGLVLVAIPAYASAIIAFLRK